MIDIEVGKYYRNSSTDHIVKIEGTTGNYYKYNYITTDKYGQFVKGSGHHKKLIPVHGYGTPLWKILNKE